MIDAPRTSNSALAAIIMVLAGSLASTFAPNRSLFIADDSELTLDRNASGLLQPDVWQIVFSRVVAAECEW